MSDANTPKQVKATGLNVWALKQQFAGQTRTPNRIERVRAPHIRRCIKAGLVVVEGNELVLTEAGIVAVANCR